VGAYRAATDANSQGHDRVDFHEVGVCLVKNALVEAFKLGVGAAIGVEIARRIWEAAKTGQPF
jgi:hypothetical protein